MGTCIDNWNLHQEKKEHFRIEPLSDPKPHWTTRNYLENGNESADDFIVISEEELIKDVANESTELIDEELMNCTNTYFSRKVDPYKACAEVDEWFNSILDQMSFK